MSNARPDIESAVAKLGPGSLTEAGLRQHVHPLFARVLRRNAATLYLANHSLGRPLDQTARDVAECMDAWYADMDGAWDAWKGEMDAFRTRTARLLGVPRPDCIVPKMSAGQGLRAVLNTYDRPPRVVTTESEFDSIDFILRQYAARDRARVTRVAPDAAGRQDVAELMRAITAGADLVVVSQVFFGSGAVLAPLPDLVTHAHTHGACVLLDVYHAAGVLPLDLTALDVDFAVGGSYKYLRGGPGACWLYLHPRHLDGSLTTLDTGWFAKRDTFGYARSDAPQFADGGDAFLESTPAVVPFYQARAGQRFTLAMGVARLREYSLRQQRLLQDALTGHGIRAHGGDHLHGAFLTVRHPRAAVLAQGLREHGVTTDARGEYLRLCPDLLNTEAELLSAGSRVAEAMRAQQ